MNILSYNNKICADCGMMRPCKLTMEIVPIYTQLKSPFILTLNTLHL